MSVHVNRTSHFYELAQGLFVSQPSCSTHVTICARGTYPWASSNSDTAPNTVFKSLRSSCRADVASCWRTTDVLYRTDVSWGAMCLACNTPRTTHYWLAHFTYVLTRWNGTNCFETFIETDNSCCAPRFPLIASCCKIVDSQISFTLCWGDGVGNFRNVG